MPRTTHTCSLNPADQELRLREFADLAADALIEAVRTPDGARVRLRRRSEVEGRLGQLIEAEQHCCSFLDFAMESGEESLTVEVSGPPAARELIDRLFELELERAALAE